MVSEEDLGEERALMRANGVRELRRQRLVDASPPTCNPAGGALDDWRGEFRYHHARVLFSQDVLKADLASNRC